MNKVSMLSNHLYRLLLLSTSFLFLTGCDDNIDFPFQSTDRIQFKHYEIVSGTNGKRVYGDTIIFSMGLMPDSILVDTLDIPVEVLGSHSDRDRTYKVKVLPVSDSIKAEPGLHYEAVSELQTFSAGQLVDSLKLVIYRKNLSTSFRNPKTIQIDFELQPTDDFGLGLSGGLRKTVLLNNYLTEPDWWKKNFYGMGTLDYYHPKKWKILISFNDKFADQHECPFDTNNEGNSYKWGLYDYLNAIPTYDDETGERILFNKLVPPVK